MRVLQCSLATAAHYVNLWHRHHVPSRGHIASFALVDDAGMVHGVATIGRPVSRVLDDWATVEVTRLATDGTPNTCSQLYGATARWAVKHGQSRIVTYILASEPGTSLRAAGWIETTPTKPSGKLWTNRPGRQSNNLGPKRRFQKATS
jgi:hypothetical protein